ncbi:MAG: hypothetical protein ACP5QO_10995 [Clostridia bacterium]
MGWVRAAAVGPRYVWRTCVRRPWAAVGRGARALADGYLSVAGVLFLGGFVAGVPLMVGLAIAGVHMSGRIGEAIAAYFALVSLPWLVLGLVGIVLMLAGLASLVVLAPLWIPVTVVMASIVAVTTPMAPAHDREGSDAASGSGVPEPSLRERESAVGYWLGHLGESGPPPSA